MKNLFKTSFAGLNLSNPIIIGSSGLTNTAAKNKELEKAGAGAVVLKSLFEEQITMQADALIKEDSNNYPEAEDYIYNYIRSHQVNDYLNLIQESKQQCTIPVIASINCYRNDSWIDFAHQIERAGADAIELNIFALNTDRDLKNNSLEEVHLKITRKIKEVVNIPVIIKMSKYSSHIVGLVNDLYKAGANGVVLFNRFFQPDINISNLQVSSGPLFSSPTDISDTLRWTAIVSGKIPGISVASSTGVHDAEDLIKCVLCGASAVEICSTVYQQGNEIIATIKGDLEEWMHGMNFCSIADFRGKMSYSEIEDPSLYERSQFMKYFSNRD
ncbi:dihydroorotate dehydrogenase-like protein [Bacteroidales bacterium OttesenSCG-928-A17]|nr:dihydroorotate dehydrogenase-like protein [Bacteroidales bacterium OttesenSCG-928-A17]